MAWARHLQVLSPASTIYSEADGFALLRGYKLLDAGGCKVVLHPQWSSAFYPATFVTNAPVAAVYEALEEKNEETGGLAAS